MLQQSKQGPDLTSSRFASNMAAMKSDVDEFVTRIEADLRGMATQDADLAAEEEVIRSKRSELRSRLAELTRLRDVYRSYMGIQSGKQPDKGLFDAETPRAGTIADLAFVTVQQHGGQMKVRAIQDELTRIGKLKGGPGDYGTLFGSLSRDRRFMKASRGVFQIAESTNGQQPKSDG